MSNNLNQNMFSTSNQRMSMRTFESNTKGIGSRSRLSTIYNAPNQRNTTMVFGRNDPRPLTDSKFKEESTMKLFSFLVAESYDQGMKKGYFSTMKKSDFLYMFYFLLLRIRRDDHRPIPSTDEEVLKIATELGYPGTIKKSHLSVVTSPSSWPYVLGLLIWMVELASYFMDLEEKEPIKICPSTGNINDDLFNDFVNQAYMSQSIEESQNDFRNRFESVIQENIETEQKVNNRIEEKTKEEKELEENSPKINELLEKERREKERLNESKNTLEMLQQEGKATIEQNEKKNKIYSNKQLVVDEVKKRKEYLEEKVKTQKVSFEEYNTMKEKKANLDLTYQALSKKKEELIKKAKELNEKCNSKKMEIIKFSLAQKEQYKIENLEIDKLISLCEDVNFKVTDMKEKYVSFTDELKQKVSSTENEKKEIQQNLLNLQNELRQIEDLISSSSISLTQKQNELQLLQSELEKNKTLDNQFNENYKTEIKTYNEQLQNSLKDYSQYEKTVEDLKKRQDNLKEENAKDEKEATEYCQKLDEFYNNTLLEMLKMKNENTKALEELNQEIKKTNDSLKSNLLPNEQ